VHRKESKRGAVAAGNLEDAEGAAGNLEDAVAKGSPQDVEEAVQQDGAEAVARQDGDEVAKDASGSE